LEVRWDRMPRPKRYAELLRVWIDYETVKMIDTLAQKLGLEKSDVVRLMLKHGYLSILEKYSKILGGKNNAQA
jgi:hypothetical protein